MDNYITIKFRKFIKSEGYLVVYAETNGHRVFPMLIPQSAYYYLEKIYSDKIEYLKDIYSDMNPIFISAWDKLWIDELKEKVIEEL